MKKALFILMALLLVSAGSAQAHCGGCGVGDAKPASSDDKAMETLETFKEKLELSDEQAATLTPILKEKYTQKKAIKAEKKVKMDALKEEYTGKIKAVLDEGQQAKLDEMIKNHEKDSKKSCADCEKCSKKGSHKGSHGEHEHEHKGSHGHDH